MDELQIIKAELNQLVCYAEEVRRLQNHYFLYKGNYNLQRSKEAERKLDTYIATLRKKGYGTPLPTTEQKSMF